MKESIETLKRLYAIVFALAITEALKRLFLTGQNVEIHYSLLPQFIALIFTIIPFVQGSNRHLDEIRKAISKKDGAFLHIIFLLDFLVFLVQGCLFFLLAISIENGVNFFTLLLIPLGLDIIWAFATYRITKFPELKQWATVNIVSVGLIGALIQCLQADAAKMVWGFMLIAILRTILDYKVAWKFYFPPSDEEASGSQI